MKPIRHLFTTFALGLLLLLAGPAALAAEPTENQLKAALLYKFAQFTTWPTPAAEAFNICVLGENPFGEELDSLKKKTLRDQPVDVIYLTAPDAARNCHLVYLNPPDRRQLTRWMEMLKSRPILTVSDDQDGWREGVMIVFEVEPNGVKFNVNLTAARAANFSISAQMLKLAREVR